MKMFKNNEYYEVIPIFLAYNDPLPDCVRYKYPMIRVIESPNDLYTTFNDIDICVNNLWIALDTIKQMKDLYHARQPTTVPNQNKICFFRNPHNPFKKVPTNHVQSTKSQQTYRFPRLPRPGPFLLQYQSQYV